MQSGSAINVNLNTVTTGATVYVANQGQVSVSISSVAISSMPAMSVNNFPAVQTITGPVYWASTQVVSVSNLPNVQQIYWSMPQDVFFTNTGLDVSGSTVNVNVSTHVYVDNQVTVSTHVTVDNFPASQAVTGAFFQATQPVSGSVSVSNFVAPTTHTWVDNEVVASTHVIVDNLPATQTVQGTVSVNALPAGSNSIGTVNVGNAPSVSVSNFPASQVVTGTFFQATQPVSISSSLVTAISLGTSASKTSVLKTGTLVTTAVTANQVVSTYTVTAGKTFYMEYLTVNARLTVASTTGSILGTSSFTAAGTNMTTDTHTNPTSEDVSTRSYFFLEPIPFSGGTGVAIVCTPASTTSMTWTANFGGYER